MNQFDQSLPTWTGVVDIPHAQASALFVSDAKAVFREDGKLQPRSVGPGLDFMPWGVDNQMPYNIISLVEDDETMTTCMQWTAEICYGAGLELDASNASRSVVELVEKFLDENDLPATFHGMCQDIKYFAFAVLEIILDRQASQIVSISRKHACYVRFAPADKDGNIPYILYANWRQQIPAAEDVEKICLLSQSAACRDIQWLAANTSIRKFAIVAKLPTADSTYYPIPCYAALIKGDWYDIKRLISKAKKAKLKNAAPIKYQIEISERYWANIFKAERITDPVKQAERIDQLKKQMVDFLTGVENTGKAWFTSYYVDPNGVEQRDVRISKIDDSKEGGEWSADIQEAVNMICFSMRVHSNLVGSVPGKSQSNNSGSDKRELYTIAQALQKPARDILIKPFSLICKFNAWDGVRPVCPFLQLTTLDQHSDAKISDYANDN